MLKCELDKRIDIDSLLSYDSFTKLPGSKAVWGRLEGHSTYVYPNGKIKIMKIEKESEGDKILSKVLSIIPRV